MPSKTFAEVSVLISKLTELESEYYDNRSRLAFFYADIDPTERSAMELKMPLLEEQIASTKQQLEEITTII